MFNDLVENKLSATEVSFKILFTLLQLLPMFSDSIGVSQFSSARLTNAVTKFRDFFFQVFDFTAENTDFPASVRLTFNGLGQQLSYDFTVGVDFLATGVVSNFFRGQRCGDVTLQLFTVGHNLLVVERL